MPIYSKSNFAAQSVKSPVYSSHNPATIVSPVGDTHVRRTLSAFPLAGNPLRNRNHVRHAISCRLLLGSLCGKEETEALNHSALDPSGRGFERYRLVHNSWHSEYHVISRKITKATMPIDLTTEYSQRSDDELLQLATQRHSLTTEAVAALDAELHRRNLTDSDRVEHQRFVKQQCEVALTSRATLVGHLVLTAPAIAAILLIPFFGLYVFGPFLFIYYVMTGIAFAWQWYLVALPNWKKWLTGKGAQHEEIDSLARRSGLAWPADAAIGAFALHTAAAAICGVHLGPWLLSRWYVWILPLTGTTSHIPTGNDHLQNFELVSIVPALVVGYLVARRFGRFAAYAWILPTVVLAYKLLTFTEPYTSVLAASSSMTRFEYFFVIQRRIPMFAPGFGGVDPIRVALQMLVVAPFYSGLAYSIGALAGKHALLDQIFRPTLHVEPEAIEAQQSEYQEESEKPVHEIN